MVTFEQRRKGGPQGRQHAGTERAREEDGRSGRALGGPQLCFECVKWGLLMGRGRGVIPRTSEAITLAAMFQTYHRPGPEQKQPGQVRRFCLARGGHSGGDAEWIPDLFQGWAPKYLLMDRAWGAGERHVSDVSADVCGLRTWKSLENSGKSGLWPVGCQGFGF